LEWVRSSRQLTDYPKMGSNAYADFATRVREPLLLVREAVDSGDAFRAAALAKAAAVLAAAALERYINDVVVEVCAKIQATRWDELTEGQQRYMALQLARTLYFPSRRVHRRGKTSEKYRTKLRDAIRQCDAALDSPAVWQHVPEYGKFMDGAAEPGKVEATLKMFDATGRSLFAFVNARGYDAGALARALASLIDARHRAAHALRGVSPGPTDVRGWILLSLQLVRSAETYLGFRN